MKSNIICPICRGKEFDKKETNGAMILICGCGSCFDAINKSWFHLGKDKNNGNG